MKRNLHKKLFCPALLLAAHMLISGAASGQANFTTNSSSGSWSLAASWTQSSGIDEDGIPDANDNVTILPGHTRTVTLNSSINSITFGSSGTSTATLSVSSGATLSVLSTSSSIIIQNAASASTNASIVGAGTISLNGSLIVGGVTAPASGNPFNVKTTLISTISVLTIAKDVTVTGVQNSSSRKIDAEFSINSGQVTVGGVISLITPSTNTTSSLSLASGTSAKTLNLLSASPISGSGTFIPNGLEATVNYSGADQLIRPATYNNLTLSGTGTKTLGGNTIANGSFIIGSGVNFDVSASNYSFELKGNLTNNGGTINPRTGTATFSGTALQTISGVSTSLTAFHNVNVTNAAGVAVNSNVTANGTITLTSGNLTVATAPTTLTLLSGGNVTVPTGRTLTVNGVLNAGAGVVSGAGSFVLNDFARLVTGNSGGIGATVTTSTVNYSAGASYEFQSATVAPFPSQITNMRNLVIGANVSLNQNINVAGVVTLAADNLTIPVNRILNITSGEAIAGVNFGPSHHVITQVNASGERGIIRVSNQDGADIFPIGTGTYYLPLTVQTEIGSNSSFDVFVFDGFTRNGQPGGPTITARERAFFVDAIWSVHRTGGTQNVGLIVGWPQALEGGYLSTLEDDQLGISRYNGTFWETAQGTGDNAANTATRLDIPTSQFVSPYAFSVTESGAQIPLPVRFANVKAAKQSNTVKVSFANLTEEDVANYYVERSSNGRNFQPIATLAPKANNNSRVDYQHIDNTPLMGDNYYRIRAVETTGKEVYSAVVKVGVEGSAAAMVVYPNPAPKGSAINLQMANLPAGAYSIRIFNEAGQQLSVKQFRHTGGSISEALPMENAPAGRYLVEVKGAVQFTQSFLLQ